MTSTPIAVCLLTCNRPELTARTVTTFVEFNRDREDLVLLHCDGGSDTSKNVELAQAAGFRTLVAPRPTARIGQLATLRYFLEFVHIARIPWVLWLENDWESVAPVPANPGRIGTGHHATVRLFGAMKFRGGHRARAGEHRIGTNDRIRWSPLDTAPGWEWGYAHWGAGGTLIKTSVLVEQARGATRLKDVITANPSLASVRPVDNVMWSIGEETTAGFMG